MVDVLFVCIVGDEVLLIVMVFELIVCDIV